MMADVTLRIKSQNLTERDFARVRDDLSKLTVLSKTQASALRDTANAEAAVARASKANIAVQRESEKLRQDQLRTIALQEAAEKRQRTESQRLLKEQIKEERYYLQLKERSQKAELRALNDALTFRKTLIREEQKARQATERSTRASRDFGGALDFVKGNLASLSAEMLIFAGIDLGRKFVDASREMEGYRETLKALLGDSEEAERQLEQVLKLSREPGLTAQSAVKEFVQLTAIDVGLERTVQLIKEMGNALALAGQQDLGPALLGLRQIYQRSKLSQEEISQITERLGLASRVLKEEFGTAISEDIQDALDAAGQDIDAFTNRFIAGLKKLPRAPVDTLTAATNRLKGATFELNAAIGDELNPTLTRVVLNLESYADVLRDVVKGEKELEAITRKVTEQSEGVGHFVEGIIELGKGLDNAFEGVPEDLLSISESLLSITGNILTLTGALLQLEGVGALFRKVFGIDALNALDDLLKLAAAGSDELTGFLTGRGSDAYEQFRVATFGDPSPAGGQGASTPSTVQSVVRDAVQQVNAELTGKGIGASVVASADVGRLYQRESTLVGELETSLRKANEAAQQLHATVSDFPSVTRAIEPLGRGFASSAETVSDLNSRLARSQGLLGENVTGLGAYAAAVSSVVPSVVDIAAAEKAYGEAVNANAQLISIALNGEQKKLSALDRAKKQYAEDQKAIEAWMQAHLNAGEAVKRSEARIIAVNKALGTADIDKATERLRDFDSAFEHSSVTVPRLTSAMGRFTGTLPDTETRIRDTSRQLQNLSQAALAAQRNIDFLNKSGREIKTFADSVQLTSPGGGQSQYDVIAQGAGYEDITSAGIFITKDLLSDAISLLGDLRRAEEQRAQSLVALEQQTSAKIQEINHQKAQALWEISQRIAAEEKRRFEEIKQVFLDAKAAEVEARQDAAAEILSIEQASDERRVALREAYFAEIESIEADYTRDVDALREGLSERERDRTERLTALAESAAADKIAAERQYATDIQDIQNNLVDAVRDLHEGLIEDLNALDAGLTEREAGRVQERVSLEEQAVVDRLAAEERYRSESEAIQTDLAETLKGIKARLVEDLDALDEGLAAREARRAEQRIDLENRAAAERIAAEERYQSERETIARNLVDSVRGIQERLASEIAGVSNRLQEQENRRSEQRLALEQQAAADRLAAQEVYTAAEISEAESLEQTLIGIESQRAVAIKQIRTGLARDLENLDAGLAEREARRLQERTALLVAAAQRESEIERTAREQTLQAESDYANSIQSISQHLVDSVRGIQDEISQIERDAVREREQVALDAVTARLDAEARYQQGVLRLQTDLGRELERIEDRRSQNALRTAESLSDVELQAARRREDLELRLNRGLADRPERASELQQTFNRAIEDLAIQTARREEDINIRAERERQALSDAERKAREEAGVDPVFEEAVSAFEQLTENLQTTLAGIDVSERAGLLALEKSSIEGIADAHARILELETQAGTTFEQALTNLPEQIDLTTAAFRALQEQLDAITDRETAGLAESTRQTKIGLADIAAAAVSDGAATEAARLDLKGAAELAETQATQTAEAARLAAIGESESVMVAALETLTSRLSSIDEKLAVDQGALSAAAAADRAAAGAEQARLRSGASAAIAGLEAEAGISFEEALTNYTAEVDDSTAALNRFNTAIAAINNQLDVDIAALTSESIADRASTQLERERLIGQGLTDAQGAAAAAGLANTVALQTLNATMLRIDEKLGEDISALTAASLADRASTAAARQTLIADAGAAQARLETEAGVSFETALGNYVPAVDASTAALNRFNETINAINARLAADTDALLREGAADRGQTAADILARTAARDAAVDAATDQYRQDRRAVTSQEAADIAAIRETLTEKLTAIDVGINESLSAIRENKLAFDQQIFAEIHQVNATAATEIAQVRQDAQAQRVAIEAIAQEARDNAWKEHLGSAANSLITIAGAAVGAVVAGPAGAVVGAQIGGAVGGLVEQANQELFHFEEADRIAFNLAREAGRKQKQRNYFPTPDQLQNARDVGREVVSGFSEGQADTGQSQQLIVVEVNIPVQLDREVIGRVVDEILVERAKNGQAYGSYT